MDHWQPWDQILEEGIRVHWTVTDRLLFDAIVFTAASQGHILRFCDQDVDEASLASTTLYMSVINATELIDLTCRLYRHAHRSEMRMWRIQEELRQLRGVIGRLVEVAAAHDEAVVPLFDLYARGPDAAEPQDL
eukprot:s97_g3.t1